MIPLAAIEGKLIFFAVFAVVGVINWWLEKQKLKSGKGTPPPSDRANRPIPEDTGSDSEQERLRRFLEALGVPQPQPPQQPPQPQPQRQIPATPQPQPFRGTAVIRKRDRQTRAAQPARPTQKIIRQPISPVIQPQPEMPRTARIEEAASSIERISGEFGTMNVKVEMPPVQPLETPKHLATANAGTTSVLEREGNPLVASLRRTLTNPTDIRAAFLAAELLGPPRGLQR